ncbi:uncharacterized protein [Rutidosis leptorrhynchoides]|uniref:uncharacterized protein n=1 Tax=Rutidosis leptorrhynchoides TaxID=125765 RepID=UPI003A98DDA2
MGDGKNTSFWNDSWCGSSCLKDMFPRLYRLESNKEVMLCDLIIKVSASVSAPTLAAAVHGSAPPLAAAAHGSDSVSRPSQIPGLSAKLGDASHNIRLSSASVYFSSLQVSSESPQHPSVPVHSQLMPGDIYKPIWGWSRVPSGRTADELMELENILKSIHFDFNSGEKWKWLLANDGIFTVRKLSFLIDKHILGHPSSPKKTLRNNLIPKKIEIFTWRALKKRIPVRIELDKRGIDLHSVRCPVCDDGLESVDHSLVSCKFALEVWARIYNWWNLGPCPSSFDDILEGNLSQASSSTGKKIWQGTVWVCAYYLWKNRNMKVFRNEMWCAPVLVNEIQVKAFEWISSRLKGKNINWSTWLVNPLVFLSL